MALDINGYNSAFGSFLEFAKWRRNANDTPVIDRISGGGAKSSAAVIQHPVINPTVGNPTITDRKTA